MNVEIGAEAALFPEKEYKSGIFVAVLGSYHSFISLQFMKATVIQYRCCYKQSVFYTF